MQQGCRHRILFPRRLQPLLRRQGRRLGLRRVRRRLGDRPVRRRQFRRRRLRRQPRVVPAHEQQGRLQGPDLGRDLLVLLRLPRLALEPRQGRLQLAPDVVQPFHIGLGRLQPQLRFVPPRVQARHPAGFFEDAPPVLRLGRDQLADLPLTHQGRRVRPRRGVGEQQLDVPRPHLLAIDAIGRALAPVDPARHLDDGAVGEGLGRAPLGVVDGQLDLGVVPGRAVRGPGEDHVVHARAAHGLGRVRAHDPAHALQHVRLAAAVRSHDPRQARLDPDLRRVDERLEADEPEALELHAFVSCGAAGAGSQRTDRPARCPTRRAR